MSSTIGVYSYGLRELKATQRNHPRKPHSFIDGKTETHREHKIDPRFPRKFMEKSPESPTFQISLW